MKKQATVVGGGLAGCEAAVLVAEAADLADLAEAADLADLAEAAEGEAQQAGLPVVAVVAVQRSEAAILSFCTLPREVAESTILKICQCVSLMAYILFKNFIIF